MPIASWLLQILNKGYTISSDILITKFSNRDKNEEVL